MEDNNTLRAFDHTLIAICYLATLAGILAMFGRYTEALGFGGVVMGLIGMIKLPTARNVTVDNTTANPVQVEPAS